MFISLEGIEGCGKTTQLEYLSSFLEDKGHPYVVTREPGGTAIGEKIRSILLDPESKDLVPAAELLLYMADRAQHIDLVIRPHLADGKIVLCDRYFDATVVYQGFARGLDTKFICSLHRLLFEDLKPDITLLLDLPPRIGLERAWKELDGGNRSDTESRFEEETISFHEKVRAGYLELARFEPDRFKIIDASQELNQVQSDIRKLLTEYLK
ncbi:MAG: dTMP kinase [Deltaproteobacteria bacterium]|jgi:dTMP kinase|nr:dTMP kinase [Deltaproteobacteria bacterium]